MLETKRLILRKITINDAEDIFEYAQDDETGPRAGWQPHKTIEDTYKVLNMWLDQNCKEQIFALVHKPNNKVIGTMGIVHLNEHKKDNDNIFANKIIESGKSVYEIGVTLSKDYWGKGLATEALSEMLDYLFTNLNAYVVLTLHFEENVASRKVQETNNMKVIGCYQHKRKWFNTECRTMIVRGKTHEEWLNEKTNQLTKE